MDTFGDMKVSSKCEEATYNVRNRIKEQESLMIETDQRFQELSIDGTTQESSMDLFRHTVIDDDFSTFDPENDEVFSIKDVKSLLY